MCVWIKNDKVCTCLNILYLKHFIFFLIHTAFITLKYASETMHNASNVCEHEFFIFIFYVYAHTLNRL